MLHLLPLFLSSCLLCVLLHHDPPFSPLISPLSPKPRVLSLFTVVKFSNSPCHSSLGANGTCYTATQCKALGGVARGGCAHNFGVCCVFSVGCGEKTFQNGTSLVLDTEADTSSARACDVKVCSADPEVCRLRLDFESLVLTGPQEDNFTSAVDSVVKNSHSLVGQCLSDSLVIVPSEGQAPPIICGTNTGQHLYTSLRGEEAACVTIGLYISGAPFTRSVNIRATQVLCSRGPPDGCLQWLEGTSGSLRSFNNGGEATHLTGQGYSACVRREAGYCSICWAASVFQLSLQTGDAGESGARGMSEHDKDCGRQFIPDDTVQPLYAGFQDFIEIPQGRCVGQGLDTDSIDRYCGEVLACSTTAAGTETATPSTVCSSVTPFRINVYTDDFEEASQEDGIPNDASSNPQVGFHLHYNQIKC